MNENFVKTLVLFPPFWHIVPSNTVQINTTINFPRNETMSVGCLLVLVLIASSGTETVATNRSGAAMDSRPPDRPNPTIAAFFLKKYSLN